MINSLKTQINIGLGSLNVFVEKAELTRDIVTFGKMNPVYKVQLWSEEILSLPCKKGGKKPNWTQNLNIKRKIAANLLKVEIWDENKYNVKDIIGMNSLSLDNYNFLQNNKFSDWVDIYYDNKKSGKVFISFEFLK